MTVLITGGSKGIGLALADRFAQQGTNLVLVAREKDALMRAAEQLRERYPVQVIAISADLTKRAAPGHIHKELAAKGIAITGLVNNAGVGHKGPLSGTSVHDILALNVDALTAMTKVFLPDIERSSGFVINVASVAGLVPIPQMAVYAASKAYVVSFSESLSFETNARVLCICPGPVDTEFHDRAGSTALRKGARSPDQVARETMRALRGRSIVRVTDPSLRCMLRLTGWMPRSWVRLLVKAMSRD